MKHAVLLVLLAAGTVPIQPARAQSTATQIDTPPQVDPGVYSGRLKPNYPTPYEPASEQSIRATLQRVHGYLEQASPLRVVDGETGAAVSDLNKLPARVALDRTDLLILTYEWGVTYSGMLLAAETTGDARYRKYTHERLAGIATVAAHAKKHLAADGSVPKVEHGFSLRSILKPHSLDDSGSMCAAMIKAHRAGVGKELRPWIDNYVQYVSITQMRLADETLARNRPLPSSLWLDDLYMSVPCLAQAGKLIGERRYFDDAANMYRPVHLLAAHGYGPVFLAGAEMITLLRAQPDITMNGGVQFGKAVAA